MRSITVRNGQVQIPLGKGHISSNGGGEHSGGMKFGHGGEKLDFPLAVESLADKGRVIVRLPNDARSVDVFAAPKGLAGENHPVPLLVAFGDVRPVDPFCVATMLDKSTIGSKKSVPVADFR
jgi:hypothetical protein